MTTFSLNLLRWMAHSGRHLVAASLPHGARRFPSTFPLDFFAVFSFVCLATVTLQAAVQANLRLAKKQDAFFIENDFVYRRFLQLAHDGSYRQIDREHTAAAEVDRGTWTQDTDGTVLLHFTRGGLRWHALLSGPLSITLDDPQKYDALPAAAAAIRRWLARSGDDVFTPDDLHELPISPLVIAVDPKAESFRRAELETLVRQIDDFAWSEQHQTFRLEIVRGPGLPILLSQHGAVFGQDDLARTRAGYRVPRGQAPPFYFAQVSAETFAREVGSWHKLP